jgi:hypothetical protein
MIICESQFPIYNRLAFEKVWNLQLLRISAALVSMNSLFYCLDFRGKSDILNSVFV